MSACTHPRLEDSHIGPLPCAWPDCKAGHKGTVLYACHAGVLDDVLWGPRAVLTEWRMQRRRDGDLWSWERYL